MRILILEDNVDKKDAVINVINSIDESIRIDWVSNYRDYSKQIERTLFDLIIVDLIVPNYPDSTESIDVTDIIVNEVRDINCINFKTSVIALTQFSRSAEDGLIDLNSKDISVVTYYPDKADWVRSLIHKINTTKPPPEYDFAIICALQKEADGFVDAEILLSEAKMLHGITYKELSIDNKQGIIVTCPRMGLVTAAVVSTKVIEHFKPKVVCMSGICGGVEGEVDIYDVVIPEPCHQNDVGKWTDKGFVSEIYTVNIEHAIREIINNLITQKGFVDAIKKNITLTKKEYPEGKNELDFKISLSPASSGSSVITQKEMVDQLKGQSRKLSAFEMESYALYEAARLSEVKPHYFSVKSVVDNGVVKGDDFHRVACLISAKITHACISEIFNFNSKM